MAVTSALLFILSNENRSSISIPEVVFEFILVDQIIWKNNLSIVVPYEF